MRSLNVFFYGPCRYPGGPNEVNRNIVKCIHGKVHTKDYYGKISGRLENIIKILRSRVIVFSGLMFRSYELLVAKLFGKKIIYIMHGCAKIETGHDSKIELQVLKKSDLVLCVSNTYKNVISDVYPSYKDKFKVLYNGVNWKDLEQQLECSNLNNIQRDNDRIILFGGGRIIKNNISVCNAVQKLNSEYHLKYHVDVYGYYRENDDSKKISEIPCVSFHHVIPHDQVNIELMKSRFFIQNSDFESFSLSIIDALQCGCDILLSKYVGCKDIIPGLVSDDIINNPSDIKELIEKIMYLQENPNNKRLLSSIDKKATDIETRADELLRYCMQYLN